MIHALGAALWGPLVFAAGLMLAMRSPRRARLLALVLLSLAQIATVGILYLLVFGGPAARAWLWTGPSSHHDALAAAILPILVGGPLATLLSAPRAAVTVDASSDTLLLAGAALGAMLADGLPAVLVFSCLSLVPLGRQVRRSGDPIARRAYNLLLLTSAAPVCLGFGASILLAARAGIHWPFDGRQVAASKALGEHAIPIGTLLWVGVAARVGIFPFHSWIPVLAERVRSPACSMSVVSPFGILLALRGCLELVPDATALASAVLLPLAAASSAYGAVLALGQDNASRQLGYLWVSAMGAVVAGFLSLDARSLSGALLQLLALVLSMTGLWSHVRAVAHRTGTDDLRRLGGLVRTAPGLATGFLVLALATVSFPGTATFLSQDLLVEGLLTDHPFVSGILLVATAVNGITLVRSFKRIFLGETSRHALTTVIEDALPRERAAALAIMFALLVGGLVPTPLVLLIEGVNGTSIGPSR
jgi:NADH-quinone oxidoreductase subunit M